MRPSVSAAAALIAPRLAWAAEALNGGRFGEVRHGLHPLAAAHPDQPDLQHLYGVACWRCGDQGGAEAAFKAAISADRRRAAFHVGLGQLLAEQGRDKEAERSLRAALALDRRHPGAVATLAEFLNARGRPAETLQTATPLLAAPVVPEAVLAAQAEALRQLGRHAERLEACQRAVRDFPRSGVAAHNLAAARGDLGRHREAEVAAREAFTKGLDAPETWTVLGRALLGQGRLDEAEAALRTALARRPALADAHRELAQLVWMRTGELGRASQALDSALLAEPHTLALHLLKIQLLENAGETDGILAALADAQARCGSSVRLETTAARALMGRRPDTALQHAQAAAALDGRDVSVRMTLCEAYLAVGRAAEAEALAAELRRQRPEDQHVLAYQATAWRLLGDARYADLYDYARFVRSFRIEPPAGWSSLADYLAALRTALMRLHPLSAHPFGQSLRGGSQTLERLQTSDEPTVRGVFEAIDAPLRRYLAELGAGKDPLRTRNRGGYQVGGAWSVRLHPEQGRHIDHVHQMGWISSAFYVDLPPAVEAGGQEGWIQFGQPGTPTRPALGPEHQVKPEPGLLVLFPSYMWHGTLPFGGERPRLTMAFDFTPAAPAKPGVQAAG